jgi:hypothetical protein
MSLAHPRFLVVSTLAALVACSGSRTAHRLQAPRAGSNSAILGEDDIARTDAPTAYQAIRQLRPEFLSVARARGTTDEPAVYVDGVRLGGVDVLHTLATTTIREIHRLTPPEATFRFGPGHSAGAIMVVMKSGRSRAGTRSRSP